MSAAPVLLDVQGLRKRFGGLVVTDDLSLQVRAGELHALIGPNGAGKTTLVAQLAGQLPSDAGRVVFDGTDVTRLSPHQRARRGLVRSFQITRLFRSLTVLENMAFALQAQAGGRLSAWRPLAKDTALFDRARQALDRLGLAPKAGLAIDALSHGEQRALEVGLAVAGEPKLVLLDEPMAGMGAQESESMAALIAGLRGRCAVLMIEHDVEAVFRLADRVSVLVSGAVVASGEPAAVRADPVVVAAYLGDGQ